MSEIKKATDLKNQNYFNTFHNNLFTNNSIIQNKDNTEELPNTGQIKNDNPLLDHLTQTVPPEEKNYNTIDFNINPFNDIINDSKSVSSKSNNSDEEFMFVESDIKNNFIPEGMNLSDNNIDQIECDKEENSNNKGEESLDTNMFSNMKKQMNINKTLLPKVPSYPVQLNSLNMYGMNQNIGNINDSFTNNNTFYSGFRFPNNSFTMNGKNGWICPSCKNFNYESKCNK